MNPESGLADGVIAGYDPGGNGRHGLAALSVRDGVPVKMVTETLHTAEDVFSTGKPRCAGWSGRRHPHLLEYRSERMATCRSVAALSLPGSTEQCRVADHRNASEGPVLAPSGGEV